MQAGDRIQPQHTHKIVKVDAQANGQYEEEDFLFDDKVKCVFYEKVKEARRFDEDGQTPFHFWEPGSISLHPYSPPSSP